MNINTAEAICEEFCDKVVVGTTTIQPHPDRLFTTNKEIKCSLNIEHFTGLVERMVQIGFCCTQVQGDRKRKKCVAWFEPMDEGFEGDFKV